MSDAVEKVGAPPSMAAGPRRRWSEADKRRIVAESYQPGTSVALVARRNAVNANLVFNWRRQYRERGGFVPVVVEPDRLLPTPKDAGAGGAPCERHSGSASSEDPGMYVSLPSGSKRSAYPPTPAVARAAW